MTCAGPCFAATPIHGRPTMKRICVSVRSVTPSSLRRSASRASTASALSALTVAMVRSDYSAIGGVMLVAFVLPVLLVGQFQRPIRPNEPLPPGQRVEVKDGDTVLIRGGARVRIVHRSEGTVRIVYNAAHRWIAILVGFADPSGAPPDGMVDGSFRFDDVDGVWPLGERWQGSAVIDDYQMTQGLIRVGMGITTDSGLFQLFSGAPTPPAGNSQWFQDPRAAAVLRYRGGGGGTTPS